MNRLPSISPSTWLLYAGLVITCTSPVWGVAYFVNQDGSAHVESAYLLAEILRGNAAFSEIYVQNSLAVPNASFHLVLALLLQIVSAYAATKAVVCVLLAATVAAAGWLRLATVGTRGLRTSLLVGAAMAFNWLWLAGAYNFVFGVVVVAVTLGVYWRWRGDLHLSRAVMLVLLLAAAYFSHILCFAVLAGSILVLAASLTAEKRVRALAWTAACVLPFVPLVLTYRAVTSDGTPASPVWRSLADPSSLASWLTQIRSADPFGLISKTALPFVDSRHAWFVIFWPGFWMLLAVTLLLLLGLRPGRLREYLSDRYLPFAVLLLATAVLAAFGPDDFGLTRGGLIRDRMVIFAVLFAIPLFRPGPVIYKRAAQAVLVLVIVFQVAAVWDYSVRAERSAREFAAAKPAVSGVRSVASIIIYPEHPRFHSASEPQLNLYNTVGTNVIAWDNYELAYVLFPVRYRDLNDLRFTHDLASSNVFFADDPPDVSSARLATLGSALANDAGRLDAILVYGRSDDVEAVIFRYFDPTPTYESPNLRLFRRKR